MITLKAKYLNTLPEGKHTVTILWTDGFAETAFTIEDNPADNDGSGNNSNSGNDNDTAGADTAVPDKKDDVPRTGADTTVSVLLLLLLISGAGIAATGKKRKWGVR